MNRSAALVAIDLAEQAPSKDPVRRALGEQLIDHGGRIAEAHDDFTVAEFPDALTAVRCAVGLQREQSRSPDPARVRFAISHRNNEPGSDPRPEEIDDTVALLDLAEAGGISMGRTVYDSVRGHLDLRYETHTDVKDWCYACVPLRQNSHKIDLMKDSAVRIPAGALIEGRQKNRNSLLARALRACRLRLLL